MTGRLYVKSALLIVAQRRHGAEQHWRVSFTDRVKSSPGQRTTERRRERTAELDDLIRFGDAEACGRLERAVRYPAHETSGTSPRADATNTTCRRGPRYSECAEERHRRPANKRPTSAASTGAAAPCNPTSAAAYPINREAVHPAARSSRTPVSRSDLLIFCVADFMMSG